MIVAAVTGDSAPCPTCGVASHHVHSRYSRTLRDLPWQGSLVRLRLSARRFYCRSPECLCKIFAERIPEIAVPYGRQTGRLLELLQLIGYAFGGEAGWRLAQRIGIESSADTILRKLRHGASRETAPIRVLGVDDWACRKGHEYGTILVDLERHQLVDLLPDREAETLRRWLDAHPGTAFILDRIPHPKYIAGLCHHSRRASS